MWPHRPFFLFYLRSLSEMWNFLTGCRRMKTQTPVCVYQSNFSLFFVVLVWHYDNHWIIYHTDTLLTDTGCTHSSTGRRPLLPRVRGKADYLVLLGLNCYWMWWVLEGSNCRIIRPPCWGRQGRRAVRNKIDGHTELIMRNQLRRESRCFTRAQSLLNEEEDEEEETCEIS